MRSVSYKKLRLQEFNSFDVERLLKGVIDTLEHDNGTRADVLSNPPVAIDKQIQAHFAESMQHNSAEMIRVTSVLTHTDDIYSYFVNGPLFRKDRDVK